MIHRRKSALNDEDDSNNQKQRFRFEEGSGGVVVRHLIGRPSHEAPSPKTRRVIVQVVPD
jgi:hypothetical protein